MNNNSGFSDLTNESNEIYDTLTANFINVQDLSANSIVTNYFSIATLSPNKLVATDGCGNFVSQSLLGTANQVNVNTVGTTTTLSTPQDIATTSTPTFGTVTLSNLPTNTLIGTDVSGTLVGKSLLGTTSQVIVTPGTNSYTLSLPQSIATFSSPTFGNIIANGTVTTAGLNTVAGGATVYVNDPSSFSQNSKLWLNCSNTPSNKSIILRLDGGGSYGYLDCSGINGMDFTLYGTPLIRMSLGGVVSLWQWLRLGQSSFDGYFGCENPTGKFHWQFSPYSGDAMTLDCSGNIYSPSTQPCTDPSGNGSANYGALVVAGGIGCNEVYASTNISATNSVVGYTLVAGNRVTIFGVTNSTSTTTGAFINAGGCGIAKDVYIGGLLNVTGAITGSNLSGTNTGNVTLTAVGSTPNANGASISSQAVTLQPADGSNPGVVTAGTQTIGGAKTLTGDLTVSKASVATVNISSSGTGIAQTILRGSASTNDTSVIYYTGTGTTSGGAMTIATNNPGSQINFYTNGGTLVSIMNSSGVYLSNSTAGYSQAPLNYYEEYSATPTWSDGATAVVATSGSFKYYLSRVGKMVSFYMPFVGFSDSAASRSSNLTAPTGTIPTRFLPAINASAGVSTFPFVASNGTTRLIGRFEITSTGFLYLACDNFGGNVWGATNNECRGIGVSWVVQ